MNSDNDDGSNEDSPNITEVGVASHSNSVDSQ